MGVIGQFRKSDNDTMLAFLGPIISSIYIEKSFIKLSYGNQSSQFMVRLIISKRTLPDKGSLQMEASLFQAVPCAVIVPRRNIPTRT